MARRLKPGAPGDAAAISASLNQLRTIRGELARAGADQAAAKVQAAVKSTEGALRHAERRARQTLESSNV